LESIEISTLTLDSDLPEELAEGVEAFEFPGGRRFHFADPSGNVVGVWSDDPGKWSV
jgi:hypothetical protein